MRRVPPSVRTEQEIKELLKGESEGVLLRELQQRGLIKLITSIVEKEVSEFLGRGYYERHEPGKAHNGYREKSFQTAEGSVRVPLPRLRETPEPFESRLLEHLGRRTDRLGRLVIEMYVRGLSTRDIEELLRDEDGELRRDGGLSPISLWASRDTNFFLFDRFPNPPRRIEGRVENPKR